MPSRRPCARCGLSASIVYSPDSRLAKRKAPPLAVVARASTPEARLRKMTVAPGSGVEFRSVSLPAREPLGADWAGRAYSGAKEKRGRHQRLHPDPTCCCHADTCPRQILGGGTQECSACLLWWLVRFGYGRGRSFGRISAVQVRPKWSCMGFYSAFAREESSGHHRYESSSCVLASNCGIYPASKGRGGWCDRLEGRGPGFAALWRRVA